MTYFEWIVVCESLFILLLFVFVVKQAWKINRLEQKLEDQFSTWYQENLSDRRSFRTELREVDSRLEYLIEFLGLTVTKVYRDEYTFERK